MAKTKIVKLVAATCVSALLLAPAATVATLVSADLAYAKNGNGNGGGKGGGRGAENRGGGKKTEARGGGQKNKSKGANRGQSKKFASASAYDGDIPAPNAKGKLASELKNLNAARANPNAFANASPNSNIGKIEAYRQEYLASQAIDTEIERLNGEIMALDGDAERDAVLDGYGIDPADYDALLASEPDEATFDAELAALAGEGADLETLKSDLATAETTDAATDAQIAGLEDEIDLLEAKSDTLDPLGTLEAARNGPASEPLSDEAVEWVNSQLPTVDELPLDDDPLDTSMIELEEETSEPIVEEL